MISNGHAQVKRDFYGIMGELGKRTIALEFPAGQPTLVDMETRNIVTFDDFNGLHPTGRVLPPPPENSK